MKNRSTKGRMHAKRKLVLNDQAGPALLSGQVRRSALESTTLNGGDQNAAGQRASVTPVSPAPNNSFASLLDRSVARSGLSYDSFVRHITKGALGSLKIWNESDLERLLLTCERLGLDPVGRDIYCTDQVGGEDQAGHGLINDTAQSRPPLLVVSLDGWCRIINAHPQFEGMSFAESCEREDGLPLWIECTMHRVDRKVATTVREYMCEARTEQSAWLTHPRRMLRHKALVQCARLCFGLSGIYDPDEAQRIQASTIAAKENSRANPSGSTSARTNCTFVHLEGGEEAVGQGPKLAPGRPKGTTGVKHWIEKNCAA